MRSQKGTSFSEFEAALLEKPGICEEFDALQPKYDVIKRLIERRNQLRMSQTQLARIVGTKQPAISRLEKGDYNTRLSTFLKVTRALDLDVSLKTRRKVKETVDRVHA